MKCKCHPNSPFHWKTNPRLSMFATDPAFRAKKQTEYDSLTKEENIIAYKQYSVHTRAKPLIKPSLNKHEVQIKKARA